MVVTQICRPTLPSVGAVADSAAIPVALVALAPEPPPGGATTSTPQVQDDYGPVNEPAQSAVPSLLQGASHGDDPDFVPDQCLAALATHNYGVDSNWYGQCK
jgi:hypothetical protein